ncbi:hypothetical protein MRB53_025780 [Persea americana]|uniref:Uncharacterized protein n=1 Tax=Persea americana TaxID=3435 RepID=A0ACC2LHD7_PERAE|nr:hypothetical protein MRB53_025780 [Persea americana]
MVVMSTGSIGTWSQAAGGLAGFPVYPVDIMAVMSTGYTEFLLCLRNTCLSYFLQVPVCKVDRAQILPQGGARLQLSTLHHRLSFSRPDSPKKIEVLKMCGFT